MAQGQAGWRTGAYRHLRARRTPILTDEAHRVRPSVEALCGRRVTVVVASGDGRKAAPEPLVGSVAACFAHGFIVEGAYREFFAYVDVFARHIQLRVVA